MKYGLNLLLWTSGVDESIFPTLEKIKSWGYDGVELPVFDMQEPAYAKIGKKLAELGLGSTAVTVCTDAENPISPEASIRQAGVDRIKKAVDMCAAAGATHLCGPIHSALGTFVGRGRTEEEWKWGQDSLAKAADYAQKQKVTLVVEYLNRFEAYFLNCAEDTGRFCREVNHPNLKMMYDTFHANIEEKDPFAAVAACQDQMVHVHISENDRSTPGEGQINWDASFEALRRANYDGWFMIEAFGLALPELAAATRIWRRMFPNEEYLATNGLAFMKSRWEGELGR
ncbi:sugar phosphate isomerase/epimerase family protein [Planctomicrobium piriforme]|uniref:D-psicose/D-tagatose/L-ribulose 3-epimerase n=1 Tax=Planctomicrobium piriforme TaxID=1576369 RepID=A0A1I3FB87_9PLAN|nr:sugar phosphate isomerase/epimerase family protein [Planctomicrobium piriforme]SFI08432.1 D-psicose/D-tagatose/L-ribulose 3-epimerase [Planctomicrobium piriforme]